MGQGSRTLVSVDSRARAVGGLPEEGVHIGSLMTGGPGSLHKAAEAGKTQALE